MLRLRNFPTDVNDELGSEVATKVLELEKIYFKANSREEFFEVR